MDWQKRREMMERIFALLVSFAVLAERAAGLPALLRWPVLAILRYGESVARDYVMELAWEAGAPAHAVAALSAGEAATLADKFRASARLLGLILAWIRHPARVFAAVPAGPCVAAPTPPRRSAGARWSPAALPAPDTS